MNITYFKVISLKVDIVTSQKVNWWISSAQAHSFLYKNEATCTDLETFAMMEYKAQETKVHKETVCC